MSTRTRCVACGAEWPADTESCYKCGEPLGAGARQKSRKAEAAGRKWSEGALADAPTWGPYRDGDKLVLTEGEELPARCPFCNSEEVVESVELEIRRESKEMGGISGLAKAGVDKLAGWNYTGPVSVSVPVCQRHRGRFRNRMIAGLLLLAGGAMYTLIAWLLHDQAQPRGGWMDVIVAVVVAVAGTIMMAISVQNPALCWFKPRRFVDRQVWVTGASRAYLETLPALEK